VTLREQVDAYYDEVAQAVGEMDTLDRESAQAAERLEEIEKELTVVLSVSEVFEGMIQELSGVGLTHLEEMVAQGLQQAYADESRGFRIRPDHKYGRPEVYFLTSKDIDGKSIEVPVAYSGSGVAELSGLLLQSGIVAAEKEAGSVLLLDNLDRLVGHLPDDRLQEIREVIQELGKEQQVIFTTTKEDLIPIADIVVRVERGETGWVVLEEEIS
jgi:DNA repair ATPase RecN